MPRRGLGLRIIEAPAVPVCLGILMDKEPLIAESPRGRSRLLAWMVVLLPALIAAVLVAMHAVDHMHYDDLTFGDDYLRLKQGTLSIADLFTVHLEHRVTVPRVMALALHVLLGRDVRWQNALTLVLILGIFWNVAVIWRRTTGAGITRSWFALLLMSSMLFCSVQWQPLLWPMLFEIFVAPFAFTLALRVWLSDTDRTRALVIAMVCAGAAMLSFGNGPLALALFPVMIFAPSPEIDKPMRNRLLKRWAVFSVVALALYFFNFHNSAPKQFAYGFGTEDTLEHSLSGLVPQLGKAPDFLASLLGSPLSHGLHLNSIFISRGIGWSLLLLFVLAVGYLWKQRGDTALIAEALPWVLIGLFSIGTAALITIGRVWLTRSGSVALLPRYVSHAVLLPVSLVGLTWIISSRIKWPAARVSAVTAALGGVLLMLTVIEWVYGAQRMALWEQARLQGEALTLFADVMPNPDYLGTVSGVGSYGVDLLSRMNKAHLLRRGLLTDRRLNQFHISKTMLRDRIGSFDELKLTPKGMLEARGFSELRDQRPADLVIFTWEKSPGEDTIFALSMLLRYPRFYADSSAKDDDGCSLAGPGPETTSAWEGHLSTIETPPLDAPIKAWALDVAQMRVYRIPDNRAAVAAAREGKLFLNVPPQHRVEE